MEIAEIIVTELALLDGDLINFYYNRTIELVREFEPSHLKRGTIVHAAVQQRKDVEFVNTLTFIQRKAKKKGIRRLVGQYRKTDRNTAIRKVFKEAKLHEESFNGEFEAWFLDLELQSPRNYNKRVELIENAV